MFGFSTNGRIEGLSGRGRPVGPWHYGAV